MIRTGTYRTRVLVGTNFYVVTRTLQKPAETRFWARPAHEGLPTETGPSLAGRFEGAGDGPCARPRPPRIRRARVHWHWQTPPCQRRESGGRVISPVVLGGSTALNMVSPGMLLRQVHLQHYTPVLNIKINTSVICVPNFGRPCRGESRLATWGVRRAWRPGGVGLRRRGLAARAVGELRLQLTNFVLN